MEKTGAAELFGREVPQIFGISGPQVVLSSIFELTFLFTNVLSNNATAALFAPIAISISSKMGVKSKLFIMAVTFAESLIFITPMGYQANTFI